MVKGFDLWTEQLLLQVLRYASENEHLVIDYEKEDGVRFLGICLCTSKSAVCILQVVSVFLRHGARLGATTWATAEGKPEIQ